MSSRSEQDAKRTTELSIQDALSRYMQQAPLPFAITRGAEHTLIYANSAFCRLAGLLIGDTIGAPIATAVHAKERYALIALLDRALQNGVELLDQDIGSSSESASGWRCSVWPVIATNGQAEAIGLEIREMTPPDPAIALQRQVAEQMLLSALRQRGLADDAEAA